MRRPLWECSTNLMRAFVLAAAAEAAVAVAA